MVTIINKLKALLFARKCPVLIFRSPKEIEWKDGIIVEENHLKDGWEDVGWEKQAGPVLLRKDGKTEIGFCVHPCGSTIDLVDDVILHPWMDNGEIAKDKVIKIHFEGAIGKATSADIIEKGLDLTGSNKKILLGIAIGILLGVFIIAPMLQKALS